MDHLGTRVNHFGDVKVTLDLWDTGDSNSLGKSRLKYCLQFIDKNDEVIVFFEDSDFFPSPLHDLDSNESFGALLGFFAYYGSEGPPDEEPHWTTAQIEMLTKHADELYFWSEELEGENA